MTKSFIDAVRAYDAAHEPVTERDPRPITVSDTAEDLTAYVAKVCDGIATAHLGTRNATLNAGAYTLGRIVAASQLDQAQVEIALMNAGRAAGLDDDEIWPTLASGLAAGLLNPRGLESRPDLPAVTVIDDQALTPAETQDLAALTHTRLVAREVATMRARRDAKKQLDAEEVLATFREPPSRFTLTDELLIPDEPIPYTIDGLLPTGSNALLTAQYKSGKTTIINQLAKSWADGDPFLGKFHITPAPGRIALWNYELDDRLYRRWLREVGILNTDRVTVLNLRGYRMPVTVTHIEDWIVDWLTKRDVTLWVVDPFARAFVGAGKSENDNTEVGTFLDTLDVIKNRAGVSDLVLPTHTGRAVMEEGEERARGATRLDDWADVRWLLTQDDSDNRYLRASGRDVEMAEEKLTYNETTRSLTFGGGDRGWEKRRRAEDAVVEAVRDTQGISLRGLRTAVRSIVKGASNDSIDDAITAAERHHTIRVERGTSGSASRHFTTELTTIGARP